jgi:hypothetical protein
VTALYRTLDSDVNPQRIMPYSRDSHFGREPVPEGASYR